MSAAEPAGSYIFHNLVQHSRTNGHFALIVIEVIQINISRLETALHIRIPQLGQKSDPWDVLQPRKGHIQPHCSTEGPLTCSHCRALSR